jgi:hypothetical protein
MAMSANRARYWINFAHTAKYKIKPPAIAINANHIAIFPNLGTSLYGLCPSCFSKWGRPSSIALSHKRENPSITSWACSAGRRAAEKRDEVAPIWLIELHPIPH